MPVAINKLDYSVDASKQPNWNQRPRDVANVARWIGRQSESELHWQIVNITGSVGDLHDAPVLYISGNEPLNLRAEDKARQGHLAVRRCADDVQARMARLELARCYPLVPES
jgi:hypothetical protein